MFTSIKYQAISSRSAGKTKVDCVIYEFLLPGCVDAIS